jgi:hypothetical protein
MKYANGSPNEVSERYAVALADHIANGLHPKTIARRIHPHDGAKRRRLYKKLRWIALRDARVANQVREDVHLGMMVDLVPAVAAVGQRAKRGRVDAMRYISEASGFHSNKVQHEHSGEISIKLDLPRPKYEQEIVEADVVDEPTTS